MSPEMQRAQDEQVVLAALLAWPHENRWELDGIRVEIFSPGPHRHIAQALIDVRDSGRRVHWRRVRALLRKRGWACAQDVQPLVRAIGTSVGLTQCMSRILHRRAA